MEMANNTVTGWGQALMFSLAGALSGLFSSVPRILGFAVILLVGWLVAGLVAGAAAALLRSGKFNELATRSGFAVFVKNAGVSTDPAGPIAGVVKWAVRLITLVVAFDALGLPTVSDVLRQLLLWLPNLIVALVVLVFSGLAAGAPKGLVRGATASAGFGNPDLLGHIASIAVWAFGIVVAVNQLGVATNLVNTPFIAITGALALAIGLASGPGGRETAAEIVRGWYEQGKRELPKAKEKLEQVAGTAQKQAQQGQPIMPGRVSGTDGTGDPDRSARPNKRFWKSMDTHTSGPGRICARRNTHRDAHRDAHRNFPGAEGDECCRTDRG